MPTRSPDENQPAAHVAAAHLAQSRRRMQAVDIERLLADRLGLSRRRARAVIRQLVQTGEWMYTYEHGNSFLEPSYGKPVRVGERIVLVPADQYYVPANQEVAVRIAAGASFGSGRHPTTRLAIRGVEQALKHLPSDRAGAQTAALDIGTGSGVLVMAAVKLGIGWGLGIDTEACARAEARENVRLNRLSRRITVSDRTIQEIRPTGRFFLVAANLRLPTLLQLAPTLPFLTSATGRLVLSGIRAEEMARLERVYRKHRFGFRWAALEKGWGAVVLQKDPQ